MEVTVLYCDIEATPWTTELLRRKLQCIARRLGDAANCELRFRRQQGAYVCELEIETLFKSRAFVGQGETLYEAFVAVIEEAARALRNRHRGHPEETWVS